jgi:cytidylate kinase
MNKIIAIDGPTASGKGTLAKRLAQFYGLPYLNTGALYRAVALHVLKNCPENLLEEGKVVELLPGVDFSDLENPELYSEEVSASTPKIAKIPELRKFLFNLQSNFANQAGGAVLDGRDIGTAICPQASYKFFITASVEERAKRRYQEVLAKGEVIDYNEILNSLKERDRRDSERVVSPLRKAEDALEIDTTAMGIEDVFNYVRSLIKI